jgi:23S rRNA (guanosine2251-2'-O)-methyltransferase
MPKKNPANEFTIGLHAVGALLKSAPQRVLELHCLKGRHDQRLHKLIQQAEKLEIRPVYCSRPELDAMTEGNHQGIIARCSAGEVHDEQFLNQLLDNLDEPAFLLVLDGVTDPHNLGACLRSANAAGVHAVIAPKDNAVGINETVRKVASGAAELVPFIPVTNLARTLKSLQQRGIWLTGTAEDGDRLLYEAELTGPLGIVMGAEGKGLRKLTRDTCDFLVRIPMSGDVSSLNVSVATGVCLFEAVRQRRLGAG